MDKMINCKDLGSGCDFAACATTEVELFKEVLEHAQVVHRMQRFSQEFYDKVRSSIQEGYCDLEENLDLCKYSDLCS